MYYMRVNTDCSMEDSFNATSRVVNNLKGLVRHIGFDHAYTLHHTIDEYLSIGMQLQDRIETKEYQETNGHICIELKDKRA